MILRTGGHYLKCWMAQEGYICRTGRSYMAIFRMGRFLDHLTVIITAIECKRNTFFLLADQKHKHRPALHCILLWAIKPQEQLAPFNSAHLMSSKIAWGTENWEKADKVLCSAMNESTKMAEQQHCKKGQGSHPSRWNCSAMPPNWNHSFFPLWLLSFV